MDVAILSGGYDPIHEGHIESFKAAKRLHDTVIVGCNTDEWLCRKKGFNFMPQSTRIDILKAIRYIDDVVVFDDRDGTAYDLITKVVAMHPINTKIYFCNGGDRCVDNIPEKDICYKLGVDILDGVGGTNKLNSSSDILNSFKRTFYGIDEEYSVTRQWGNFTVLYNKSIKVKILKLNPGKSISLQYHNFRNEYWNVIEGDGIAVLRSPDTHLHKNIVVKEGSTIFVPKKFVHKLTNTSSFCDLCVIEVQTGTYFGEDDIKRFNSDYEI